ncbi:MAG: prohibitin family protein [Bdellovibrionota bacterium]
MNGAPRGILAGALIIVALSVVLGSVYIVQPGTRGVVVTLGKVEPGFRPEGMGFRMPFVTSVIPISIRQIARPVVAQCYSSDLQQVNIEVKVLYRIPEEAVVSIYQQFAGDPFDTLIAPRVNEAIKEITALQSAEAIVKKREEIKTAALDAARKKIGKVLDIEDLVLQNISLSQELETAIEAKMVQEQTAAKARFVQQQTEIEANTAVIRAKGEAESIKIRGEALTANPSFISLQIIEKWDGRSPTVVGSGTGANILLPMAQPQDVKKPAQ